MRLPRRQAAIVAVATGLAIVVTAGTASAFWGVAGSGHGAARSGVAAALQIEPGTAASALVPGATADVVAVISNPTEYPVLVTSVTTPAGGIPGFEDAGLTRPSASCDAARSGVAAARTTPRPASFVIAAHGSYTLTLSAAVTMTNESDSACQGLFFAVQVTVTAASAVGSAASQPAGATL